MASRVVFFLVLIGSLAACSGPPNEVDTPPALLDVWVGLDDAAEMLGGIEGNPCTNDFGTWFHDFGARGLACVAAEVMDPSRLIAQSGGSAFESGPHTTTAEYFHLNLNSEREFGHYDEAFVDWLIDNGIVGEGRPVACAHTGDLQHAHPQTGADLLAHLRGHRGGRLPTLNARRYPLRLRQLP